MAVRLISTSLNNGRSAQLENKLGLLSSAKQTKRKTWISKSHCKRISLKREAYLQLFQEYDNEKHTRSRNEEDPGHSLYDVLVRLSNGEIDIVRHGIFKLYPKLQDNQALNNLVDALADEDKREYDEILKTLLDAKRHGVVAKGPGRNEHLAEMITMFSYLYGRSAKDNPLLFDDPSDTSPRALLNKGIPNLNAHGAERKAVENYLEHIAIEINRLINLTPEELEMAFPDDDVKHVAIIKKLKSSYNRLAMQYDYPKRFENPRDELGEKTKQYCLVDNDLNTSAKHKQLRKKQQQQVGKTVMIAFAIFAAILIATGQVAISVSMASGTLALLIASSTGIANTFLFARDIKGLGITALVKKELFKGMGWELKIPLMLYGICSLATGVTCGGLVYGSMLHSFFHVAITAATAPQILICAPFAAITVLGLSSLLFMVGVNIAKGLRGKTGSQVWNAFKADWKAFFKKPEYNRSILDLEQEIKAVQTRRNTLMYKAGKQKIKPSNMEGFNAVNRELSALKKEYALKKFSHNSRHKLKIFFSLIFIPLSIAASIFATFALLKTSCIDTAGLFQTLHMSEKAAALTAAVFTWGFAAVVQGSLNTKSLIGVANRCAAVTGKFVSGFVYGVGIFFTLLFTGRLGKAFSDGVHAFKNNPYKTIVPGLRYGLLVGFAAAVALNGYGNGAALSHQGSMPLPSKIPFDSKFITMISATLASCGMNLDAILDAFKTDTPMRNIRRTKNDEDKARDKRAKDAVAAALPKDADFDLASGGGGGALFHKRRPSEGAVNQDSTANKDQEMVVVL